MTEHASLNRRTFVKATGAAAGAAAFAGHAAASGVSTRVVDQQFDDSGLQDAVVVFDGNESVARLDDLDLADGYYRYEVLPMGFTRLRPDQIREVADWDEVRRVKRAEELEWYNDLESKRMMNVLAAQAGRDLSHGYEGEGVDVVVIDSGVDGSHPGLAENVVHNYEYVDELLGSHQDNVWVDVGAGDSDDLGHGTHCCGIVAGTGDGAHGGSFGGMAPEANVTAYSTSATVYLPYALSAWDHMIAKTRADSGFDPKVCSNSYGVARGMAYNPNDPVNVATWEAFNEGILPVFAQGNSGPDPRTSSRFAKAPHVLGVAAAEKSEDIVGFSSRGRDDFERGSTYYDREAALDDLRKFKAIQDGDSQFRVRSGSWSNTFGPAADANPAYVGEDEQTTGPYYHELTTGRATDLLEFDFSVSPSGQWLRVTVYEGSKDGERVAAMGEEPFRQHRGLAVDVKEDTRYVVEVEPEATVAGSYTVDWETFAEFEYDGGYTDRDLAEFRDENPLTLWRPGIATHGVKVMSTVDPHDALGQLGPLYGGDDHAGAAEPFYTRLSGTSMACPAAAGIAALVAQALEENGASADPLTLVRILENTTRHNTPEDGTADARKDYTIANAGAGLVDAQAAVELAEEIAAGASVPESGTDVLVGSSVAEDLDVSGARSDGGDTFTADDTKRVTVEVTDLSHDAAITDTIPESWTVVSDGEGGYYGAAEEVTGDEQGGDDTKTVHLGTVEAKKTREKDGGKENVVRLQYFVRAPSSADATGRYVFGPAHASTDADIDGSTEADFGGTDAAYVVGASSETPL